jgi:hypothetical protein
MRVSVLSISALEDQCYGVSFFCCGVYIRSMRGQEPRPPFMIGISDDSLYMLWGQPIYHFGNRRDGTVGSYLREKEALLSRSTWWERTLLEGWGYPDKLISDSASSSYRTEQVKYLDLERLGLSDSKGETHSDADHGGGSSNGSISLTKRES